MASFKKVPVRLCVLLRLLPLGFSLSHSKVGQRHSARGKKGSKSGGFNPLISFHHICCRLAHWRVWHTKSVGCLVSPCCFAWQYDLIDSAFWMILMSIGLAWGTKNTSSCWTKGILTCLCTKNGLICSRCSSTYVLDWGTLTLCNLMFRCSTNVT